MSGGLNKDKDTKVFQSSHLDRLVKAEEASPVISCHSCTAATI